MHNTVEVKMEKKMPEITFEKLESKYYPTWGFRDKIVMFPIRLNFVIMNGGMGDYVTWLQAIRWIASEATWIEGHLIIPTYMKELAEYWLKPYALRGWKFTDYPNVNHIPKIDDTPFRGPVDLNREALNATGAHLITCGWVYFTNKECAPDGIDWWTSEAKGQPCGWDSYPQFRQSDLDQVSLPAEAATLERGKYAVITTGMTTPSRRVPQGSWNPIIEHVLSKNLQPVFLGKEVVETGNAKNIHTKFEAGTRYDLGINLRNKTSLMQAASIMSNAAVVIGHDNGLLHLAGCTEVPIVFGYNLASPKHREPRRPVGKTYNVVLTSKELACNFCQSNTNFVIGYNFRSCYYADNKCMTMLFEQEGSRWKNLIDEALEHKNVKN